LLTVAHNVYTINNSHNFKSHADEIYFFPEIYDQNKIKQKIKIKIKSKTFFSTKYTTLGDVDRRFYDIAIL